MAKFSELIEAIGGKVDAEAGIIRGVRILGRTSRNGRRYSDKALESAARLYDGRKVNVNHIREGKGERPLQDAFGEIRNPVVKGDFVEGDLHYLTKHSLAPVIAEAAQKFPKSFGLSHHAEGETRREGKDTIVEDVTAVHSVDLVSDPATNNGLFESVAPQYAEPEQAAVSPQIQDAASQIAVHLFASDKSDEQVMKDLMALRRIIKGQDSAMEAEPDEEDESEETKESVAMKPEDIAAQIQEAVKPLKESLDSQAATLAAQALELKCHRSGVAPTKELLESFAGKDAAFIDGKLAEMAKELKEASGKPGKNPPANTGTFDLKNAKGRLKQLAN